MAFHSKACRLALSMAAAILAIPGARAADFFFIQMSDPQFGMYTKDHGFEQETANFEFAIATANRLRPAFVIVTGDLVDQAGNAAEIAEYLRIARKLNGAIPLYNVAGNHDVENSPTPQTLAAYRKTFGPDYYTFRLGAFEGIVLDSSLMQHPEGAPEEALAQERWLQAELAGAGEGTPRRVMVFQHIPLFVKNEKEPENYFNLPAPARMKYLEWFQRAGVEYVFAGHLHDNSSAAAGSLHMITTGPVGKPLHQTPSGMRIVGVTDTGVHDRYYDLGNLPNRVVKEAGQLPR